MLDKKWYLSKTFWFNLIALIVVVVTAFGYGEFEPDAKIFEYGGMLVTLINIALRFVTKKGIRL